MFLAIGGAHYFDTDLNVSKTFAVHDVATGTFGKILETAASPPSAYGSFQGSAVSGRVIQRQLKFIF